MNINALQASKRQIERLTRERDQLAQEIEDCMVDAGVYLDVKRERDKARASLAEAVAWLRCCVSSMDTVHSFEPFGSLPPLTVVCYADNANGARAFLSRIDAKGGRS